MGFVAGRVWNRGGISVTRGSCGRPDNWDVLGKRMGYGAEVGVEVLTMVVVLDILSDYLVGMWILIEERWGETAAR
jgi:hypothetical protein